MLNSEDRLIQGSRFLVKMAALANHLFLLVVVLGLLLSAFAPQLLVSLMQGDSDYHGLTINGLRWEMLLGVVMAVAIDRLLASLARIVASAGEGDPFVAANADRLKVIGWALLVLQLLDICNAMIVRFFPALGSESSGPPFSSGGWLAVLMAFVLSRVFAAGSTMREDLAGTV